MKIFGYHILKELPKPEKETVYIELGEQVDVYQATWGGHYSMIRPEDLPKWHGAFFLSCKQALDECEGAVVSKLSAYKVGNEYFRRGAVYKVEIEPKPKVAKGGQG